MKKSLMIISFLTLLLYGVSFAQTQVPISQLTWKYVATQMPDEWYGSEESIRGCRKCSSLPAGYWWLAKKSAAP